MKLWTLAGRWFDRILGLLVIIAGILVILLMLIVTLEVCLRYFFGRPTSWVVEVSGYIVLFIPFLVAPWVLKNDGHVKMDILLSHLPPKTQEYFSIITSFVSTIVCLILTWFGIRSTLFYYNNGYKTPTVLMVPKYLLIMVISIGLFFLFIQCLRKTLGHWGTYHKRCDDIRQ